MRFELFSFENYCLPGIYFDALIFLSVRIVYSVRPTDKAKIKDRIKRAKRVEQYVNVHVSVYIYRQHTLHCIAYTHMKHVILK